VSQRLGSQYRRSLDWLKFKNPDARGFDSKGAGGAKVLVGGEVGGLGSQSVTTWSVKRGRASLPF
jgi:hypothetical protein